MNDNQPHSSPAKKNPTLRPKPIPHTSFCQNIPRICGVVFDFPAEICHGYPHKLKIFHCNVSPDFFCDITLCNYIFLCIFRECLSLIVLNPDSNLFLCWIKQGQTLIIQGVPPQAGSAVPGFRAQGTPLLRNSLRLPLHCLTQESSQGGDSPHLLPPTSAQLRPTPGLPIAHLPDLYRRAPEVFFRCGGGLSGAQSLRCSL